MTPLPSVQARARLLLLSVALTACASPGPGPQPVDRSRPRGSDAHAFELTLRERGLSRVVRVERTDPYRYRITSCEPALGPDEDAALALRGLWPQLEPEAVLELGPLVSASLSHPDPAILRELLAALERTPPDPVAVVAGLPRLARLESRVEALTAAACVEPLSALAYQALLDALTDERGLRARAPGAYEAGGTLRGLEAVLAPLVEHPLTGADEARVLLLAAREARSYDARESVLLTLEARGLLSVEQVLAFCSGYLGYEQRPRVLARLVARERLTPDEAAAVLLAAQDLRSYDQRLDVLVALDARRLLSVSQALRFAAGHLGPEQRRPALLRLAQRERLTPEEADAIAAGTQHLRSYDARTEVLLALVGKLPADRFDPHLQHLDTAHARQVREALAE